MQQPLMVLKPKFLALPSFLFRIPLTLFMTVWSAGFFGGFSIFGAMGLKHIGVDLTFLPVWSPFVFFGGLAFFMIQFYSFYMDMKKIQNTEYRFYEDELVCSEFFLGVQEKTISYSRILEIGLQKGIFQQKYGVGTITASTAATEGAQGIKITDIPNPDTVYNKLRQLVKDSKSKQI